MKSIFYNPVAEPVTRPDFRRFRSLQHDHDSCIHTALEKAQAICAGNNTRFTHLRKRVLELIWSSHKPVPAYDLLETLRNERTNAQPPTVYRTLDFLLKYRLIHKIESLRAYVGCDFPEQRHVSQFLICNRCHQVVELNDSLIRQVISRQARKAGLEMIDQTVEILGRCLNCQSKRSQTGSVHAD